MPGKTYHPEPSAAFLANEKTAEIIAEIDRFQACHPIAGRLVQTLLLRQIAGDLAPVLLELMADVALEPDMPAGRRRGDAGRARV
ncbi:MAG: hypothetical protein ACREFJ_18875 [Acetobacteraceae bacterium]